MVGICNAESAVVTCDPSNFKIRPIKPNNKPSKPNTLLRRFSFSELNSATSSFSPSRLLGRGSHGAVYLATLDSNTLLAAVKRPTHSSTSSSHELSILSNLHSPTLVNLIGYSLDPATNLRLLVFQHMPNGSLHDLLHKSPNPPRWTRRVNLALQVAQSIAYLHSSNPPVIHRDIKSTNILIDGLRRARLGDFGLAIRGHVEDVRALKTPPAGTLGYLDPCYLAPGDLSVKSDVYSFGILLLEIISGRRAIDVNHSPPSLEDWALPLIKAGRYDEICDRRIGAARDRRVVIEMAHLAVRCVKSDVEKRPDMVEAVECLSRVYKRVRSPLWSRVGKSRPLMGLEEGDEKEEKVRAHRVGNRRSLSRSRKVSNVASPEEIREEPRGGTPLGRRSKSFGSVTEFRVRAGVDSGVNAGKQKVGPRGGINFAAVKLRKSRSVGVKNLQVVDGKSRAEIGHVIPLAVNERRIHGNCCSKTSKFT